MFKRYALLLLIACGFAVFSAHATASTQGVGWIVNSHTYPTNLAPGGNAEVIVEVYDVGAMTSSAGATVTDTLPDGVSAVSAGGWSCTTATPVTCTYELPSVSVEHETELVLNVSVSPSIHEGRSPNEVTVAGGGAPNPSSASNLLVISSAPVHFGFADADAWFTNADGTVDTQAGSHPYEVTFNYDLDAEAGNVLPEREESRNVTVNLPPGLIGNPQAVPQCTRRQFDNEECPASTQIGIAPTALSSQGESKPLTFIFAVYNIVPPPGQPAQFAFNLLGVHAILDAAVRSGGDYGITEHVYNVPQREVVRSRVTLWGVPADPSHDSERKARGCEDAEGKPGCASSAALTPFLTLPTSCAGPQTFSVSSDTWASAGTTAGYEFLSHDASGKPAAFTGCDHLGFGPSISVAPDTSFADTPAGLTVDVKVPQEGLSSEEGLSTSNIKGTTVTLPDGLVINPGQAAGLQACQSSEDAVGTEAAPSCPNASKVGTDEIETPLLAKPLKGDVYVLQSNPPNLKLLVAASGAGVNLKLVGDVHLDESTGRLTTTFAETPEVPFTDFKLSFSGGAQAALVTPMRCGEYTTDGDFTPWSTPAVGDVFPTSSFVIDQGSGGSACSSPLPFSPSMIAGSTTDQAGGYTSFSLLLQRADDQQRISDLQFKTPEGLLGMISKVPLCPEPQASQGACSSASQIGHTVVAAGPGPYPLVVPQPGQPPAPIYLTGGYRGAPYGLSIVVPLVVGPFTLQTQVVRGRIEVDQRTARLTVTTDPLPTIIDGIPADLRTINAVIDRPEFMFNPTDCSPQSFSGTATSVEGASTPISSPFQMGSCRSLLFKPNFKVSTSGKTSRKNGASLDAKIVYPREALGANQASSQSNLKSVKVDLPKQLPSRLTTLQKACTSQVFEDNPANCPADSRVGTASAVTPVLPVTLTGPAYFVSYGGAKFPELVFALQGYGVTIYVHGETFINKAGITSSTFHEVPDVPIYQFELKLPQGPFSALAANGNLCNTSLKMPTAFTAQDGAVIHQTTPVSVTGCAKHKTKKTAKGTIKHKKKK
jgi:hypothetical protein